MPANRLHLFWRQNRRAIGDSVGDLAIAGHYRRSNTRLVRAQDACDQVGYHVRQRAASLVVGTDALVQDMSDMHGRGWHRRRFDADDSSRSLMAGVPRQDAQM